MKTNIYKVFNMEQFFRVMQINEQGVRFTLKEPSQILMKNIHENWLQYIYARTHKQMPIYVSKYMNTKEQPPSVFGTIKQDVQVYNAHRALELNFDGTAPALRSELKLDLMVPQQLAMQYFVQWQRYRKYWWSSISMTPNLFTVSDYEFKDTTANVEIVAQFLFGAQPVESITVQPEDNVRNLNASLPSPPLSF